MEQNRNRVVLIGLAIIAGSAVVGYGLGSLVENRGAPARGRAVATVPSPTPSPIEAPLPSPTPEPVPPPPSPLPVLPVQVVFESAPERVPAGQAFVVRWRVDGPAGVSDTVTRLIVKHEQLQQVLSPARGRFTLPERFEATVRSRPQGTLTLTAEAVVNGQIHHSQHTLRVE